MVHMVEMEADRHETKSIAERAAGTEAAQLRGGRRARNLRPCFVTSQTLFPLACRLYTGNVPSYFPVLTAEEAAAHIGNGSGVALSGFTPAGSPKAVPKALAERARRVHQAGEPFSIRLFTGASTGLADDELGAAEAIHWRMPYQTSKPLRDQLNAGGIDFIDMHLSHFSQMILSGFLGEIDVAIVEASEITADGRVYLTTGIGCTPVFLQQAKKVIIEVNTYPSPRLREMTDIVLLPLPPHRNPLPLRGPMDRIGWPYAVVDPKKVVGIVETHAPDNIAEFAPTDAVSRKIAANLVRFLHEERAAGRIPREFLPLQSGVGNVGNAMIASLMEDPDIPTLDVYTEVLQDSLLDAIRSGKCRGASTCGLTLSNTKMREVFENFDAFADKIVLRPQEISNNPEIVRRLGIIATNTAIEADIYGHVNSTHLFGTQMMNGLGGSGDFERNAFLAIFMCPSVAKGGRISSIVPMCSHVDHTEHSVHVIVTEQGVADLRGLGPMARAKRIIDNCAHPSYRDALHHYVESAPAGHLRHDLSRAFDMHRRYLETGSMQQQG